MRIKKPDTNKIMFQLINYAGNKELLANIPHVQCLDLAMIFYYPIESQGRIEAARIVTNQNLAEWDWSREKLEWMAKTNTPTELPFTFHIITDVIEILMKELELPMELEEFDDVVPMYVLTNEKKLFGAACMFYPDLLKKISLILQNDFYILPSSIHECILVPLSGSYSGDELSQIVKEINHTEVPPQEVLSDAVYIYHSHENRISMIR